MTANVSGIWHMGEAGAIRSAIGRRHSTWTSGYPLLVGLLILGASLGMIVLPGNRAPGMAIGVMCAFLAYGPISLYFARLGFEKRMAEAEVPRDLPLRVEFGQEELSYCLGELEFNAKWAAVTELFSCKGYWVFLAQGSAFSIPRRFFADQMVERQLIAAALSRMTNAAKDRSSVAVAFAESH